MCVLSAIKNIKIGQIDSIAITVKNIIAQNIDCQKIIFAGEVLKRLMEG